MLRKIVWTALTATMVTIGAGLGRRGAEGIWRAVTGQGPPERPFWAKKMVGQPVKKGLLGRLGLPDAL